MAWSGWSTYYSQVWGSGNSPTIYFQWQYRYDRSGSDMMYQVWCRVNKPSGTYGYNIYVDCYMDGAWKFGTYLKNSSTASWTYYPSESGYYSGTYYVSGKTSGTTSLRFNVYSPNAGTSRSTNFYDTMTVSPAGSGISVSAPGGSYVLGDNTNYAQINLTRYSTGFTDNLSSSPSGLSASITGSTSSYDWKPIPLSFAANNLTGTTVPITVYTNTMSGSTLVERKSASFTATIPSYVKPTNPVLTITDNKGYFNTYGAYIQNMSEVKISMSANTYSGNGYTDTAAITTASILAGNNTYSPTISQVGSTNQYKTSDLLISPGTVGSRSISGSVIDARGRTSSSSTYSINVLAYSAPVITSARAFRCTSTGVASADGTYAQFVISASVTDFGTSTNNNGSYKADYVIKNGNGQVVTSGTKQMGTGLSVRDLSLETQPISGLQATYTMEVTFTATDSLNSTATTTVSISVVKKFLSANAARTGLGVGKLSTKQDGGLEIGMQTYYDSDVTTVKHESSGDAVFFDSTTSQMKLADGTVVSAQQGGLAALDYEIITSW